MGQRNHCKIPDYTHDDSLVRGVQKEGAMFRERGLKIVLVLVGLFFSAAIYPAIGGLVDPAHSDTGDTMMMSLYFALGIFLLIAVRNPSAHGDFYGVSRAEGPRQLTWKSASRTCES
jgi:hypothetical protein